VEDPSASSAGPRPPGPLITASIEIVTPLDVLEWTLAMKRGPRVTIVASWRFAMLDIDRVVPPNEANVDEYLFYRTQFCHQGRLR
jgi:hypothetical protein